MIAGTGYLIVPTRGSDIQLYNALSQLIADYAGVRDNAGQGMFGDGTVGAPGIRFVDDQDTGLRRVAANLIGLVTGGVDRLYVDGSGNVGIGGTGPHRLMVNAGDVADSNRDTYQFGIAANGGVGLSIGSGSAGVVQSWSRPLCINPQGNDILIGQFAGNLLVGVATSAGYGNAHRIRAGVGEGWACFRSTTARSIRPSSSVS